MQRFHTAGAVVGVALIVSVVGCTSNDQEAAPTPPPTAASPSDTSSGRVMLIVRYMGSDNPGAPPKNHTTPQAISRISQADRCQFYDLAARNFGGAIDIEVHAVVPADQVSGIESRIAQLPGVYETRTTKAINFNVPPNGPDAARHAYVCPLVIS